MKAAHSRFAFIACSMSTVVGILSGCAVSGKSFAIDSNSRIPFFGLELQERKPKSSAPSYRSIANMTGDAPRVEVALQMVPAAINGASKKWNKRPAVNSLPNELGNWRDPLLVVKPSGPDQSAQSIPIPITDRQPSLVDRRTTLIAVDFQ